MSRPNTQDIDLRAVFMRNWSTIDERGEMHSGSGGAMGCDWLRDWHDVQRVCRHLGNIPVELIDLSRDYWVHVFEPALGQWSDGTTPNPDVECNRSIKFGALMDRVLGAQPREHSWLATGHYARLIRRDGYTMIARAADATKDQSFFLSSVPSSASCTNTKHAHLHANGHFLPPRTARAWACALSASAVQAHMHLRGSSTATWKAAPAT